MITVNGSSYEVEVEEIRDGAQPATAPAAPAAPKQAAPKPAPVAAKAAPSGSEAVKCPMPGVIMAVNVSVGDTVKKGTVLMVLEAMKMENEIMCPRDGKVVAVNVAKGATVNSGDLLVAIE